MARGTARTGSGSTVLGALGLVILGSCVVAPEPDATSGPSVERGEPSPTLPIAVDLVSVLVQLDGYSPHSTTVQTNPPTSGFGTSLVDALGTAGYGIQLVSEDQGRNYLSYRASSLESESGRRSTFELRLGALVVARQMTRLDGEWVPVAPVVVHGASPQAVALNGSVYVRRPRRPLSYPSGVRFVENGSEGVIAETAYRYSYWPTGEAKTVSGIVPLDPKRFLVQATGRLYDAGAQAFSLRPADDFTARQSLALSFPTASDEMLGADNRAGLERLASFFDVATDRFSIVACAADVARSASAIARAARVKAELLTFGVPGDQAVEAECPSATKRVPLGRDLIVVLERLRPPAR